MKPSALLFRIAATLLLLVLGLPVLSAQTYTDNFTDPAMWVVLGTPYSTSTMSLLNNRANFICTDSGSGLAAMGWYGSALPVNRSWSISVNLHLTAFPLTGQGPRAEGIIGFGKIGSTTDSHIGINYYRHLSDHNNGFVVSSDNRINGVDQASVFWSGNLTGPDVALRLDYNAVSRAVTYFFDADGSGTGAGWVPMAAAEVGRGALDLQLSDTDAFGLYIVGSSDQLSIPLGMEYFSSFVASIDPPVGADTIRLADYYYPVQQGASWLYLGPNGVGSSGNTTHTRIRMADTALSLTLYNPAAFIQPVLDLDADFGYFSGTTFVSTDNWHEYLSISDGFAYYGLDDGPSDQVRNLMMPLPQNWMIGQTVSREIDSYSPTGVFDGGSTFALALLERASVTVPAGTYPDCIRLRFTFANGGTPQVWEEWWALGVGMVKKSRVSGYTADQNNGGFTETLASCTSPTISSVLKSARAVHNLMRSPLQQPAPGRHPRPPIGYPCRRPAARAMAR